jgi:serine/threonine protein kinase
MFGSPPFNHLVGTTLGNYRLEQLLGQSALGPLYLARSQEGAGNTYLLRILAVPMDLAPEARSTFLGRFQSQVTHLATLQHPYVLPLVDFGVHAGMPYLVWPGVPVRSVSARLAQSGPLDVVTVGRYLDQIAAALEYAHEHATLHRNLTTDCIYMQLDGRLVVADFGVRRLIELSHGDASPGQIYGSGEADAPEQFLGRHVAMYTDTYALGAALFRMLTGSPVFATDRRDELMQQHLHAPVPPLATRRSGLPPALDGVIATAMAKEPERRFSRPGAVANAFQQVVAPHNSARVPFITTTSPITSSGPEDRPLPDAAARSTTSRRAVPPGATRGPALARADTAVRPPTSAPLAAPAWRPPIRRNSTVRMALFVVVILALVGGTAFALMTLTSGPPVGAHAVGQVTFFDGQSQRLGRNDALKIVVHDLDAPPASYYYDAWLIDERSEHVIALGTLVGQGRTYVLDDPGDGQNGQPGTNLLAAGDKIEITLEQGHVTLPVGRTVLSATFPRQAMSHIRHLLVSFPTTPGQIGLLVGMHDQTQLLNAEAQALQQATASHDAVGTQCATQSLIDLIEGQHGPHYQPLASVCIAISPGATGDGFGLLGDGGYLAKAAEHTSNAAIAPDATDSIRQHAASIEVTITNVKGWLTTIDGDAVALLNNPANPALLSEVVTLADHAYHGVDANGDHQINPVAGEAGVVEAVAQAQAMATLNLAPTA